MTKYQVSFDMKTYDAKNPSRGQLTWKQQSFSNLSEAIDFIRNANNKGRVVGKPLLEEQE